MRVLVIDNYDSFVYNLVQYLAQLGADTTVRRNDAVDLDELDDVVVDEHELGHPDVLDVVERARVEVVEADNAVAAREQVFAEVRAEKAGAAGDD